MYLQSGPLGAKEYYTGCYIMYFLCDGELLLTISQDIVLSKEKPFYLCLITHDDREHECPFWSDVYSVTRLECCKPSPTPLRSRLKSSGYGTSWESGEVVWIPLDREGAESLSWLFCPPQYFCRGLWDHLLDLPLYQNTKTPLCPEKFHRVSRY